MKNFRLLSIDWMQERLRQVVPELAEQEACWLLDQSRQTKLRVQKHTQSIFLRSAVRTAATAAVRANDIQQSGYSTVITKFPAAKALLESLSDYLDGDLGRALYVRLSGIQRVYPHIDEGSYYASRDRYHLVIDSPGGSLLNCGSEQVIMKTGELWWFNNKLVHDSFNPSKHVRVHLIFDLLPHVRH